MYDISDKKIKKGLTLYLIVTILGIIYLFDGIFNFISFKIIQKNATYEIQAEKIDVQKKDIFDLFAYYKTVHYYVLNDKEYVCKNSMFAKYLGPSNNLTVYYNYNKPSQCYTEDIWIDSFNGLLDSILIGGIFALLGIINIMPIREKKKMIKYLNQYGKLVKNVPYYRNIKYRSDDMTPRTGIIIHCKLPSGEYIRFSQDDISGTKYYDKGGFVDIVYDPYNYEIYYASEEINRVDGNHDDDFQKTDKEELEQLRRYSRTKDDEIYYKNKKKIEKIKKIIFRK